MKKRSPLGVFFLSLITIGIYSWYWLVKTKGELNSRGASIPTAWIWLIPFVGTIYWELKYTRGAHVVTGKGSTVGSFFMMVLLGPIGQAIMQGRYNDVAQAPVPQ